MAKWRVTADQRVVEDLERLGVDPLAETRNLKTLCPNPAAQRELRLFGVYPVLFNVEENQHLVRGLPLMKVIPLSKAKAKLSYYAQRCHKEPIVVTVNGRPAFEMVPLDEDDDLVDRLIENHPGFRKLLKERLTGPTISAEEVLGRL